MDSEVKKDVAEEEATCTENTTVKPWVNPEPRSHGVGVWGNPRVVMGVRVDGELRKAFKRAAVDLFGSVCRPVEGFMVSVVEAHKGSGEGSGLTPGLTVGNRPEVKVEIGTLQIQRNLRSRRMLEPGVGVTREEVEDYRVVRDRIRAYLEENGVRDVSARVVRGRFIDIPGELVERAIRELSGEFKIWI